MKWKIKKDDTVQIMSGKEKGKTGKVTEIERKKGKVYVGGLNMVKKAVKKKSQQEAGGIISIEAPIPIAKVRVVVGGNPTRIGYVIEKGKKLRIAKKTGAKV